MRVRQESSKSTDTGRDDWPRGGSPRNLGGFPSSGKTESPKTPASSDNGNKPRREVEYC